MWTFLRFAGLFFGDEEEIEVPLALKEDHSVPPPKPGAPVSVGVDCPSRLLS